MRKSVFVVSLLANGVTSDAVAKHQAKVNKEEQELQGNGFKIVSSSGTMAYDIHKCSTSFITTLLVEDRRYPDRQVCFMPRVARHLIYG